ncbi:MAG: sterol carrier protein domain-containing protein, partial [Dehalococcoidia bacterium]|nr:sterol carrier protein domain-containing protein [Dehalococcoidia bacterium]
MLTHDDWAEADRVYRLHSARRNGPIHRVEVWWRQAIFAVEQPNPADVALWENGRGEPQGYVVYHQPTQPQPGPDRPPFWVRELVALTTDAYLNLVAYLLRHDLPEEITWSAPPDDPFLSLADDATKVKVTEEYDLMLRVCDVEAALKLRPPAYPDHDLALTIEVTDPPAPWNEGIWRLETADGAVNVERAKTEPDISLSA